MPEVTFIEPGPLAQIGLALRERLELAFPPTKFVHHWMPSSIDREVWEKLTQRPPMVGIGFVQLHRPETQTDLNVISEWNVWLVTRNERSPEAVLFGDRLAPGQLAIAEVGAAVLHGFTMPSLGTVKVISVSNVNIENFKADGLAITAIELTVPADLSLRKVIGGEAVTPKTLTGATIKWNFGDGVLTDVVANGGA